MKIEIYSENTHRLLFTLFDSTKKKKTNAFRTHHHPELELGLILNGSGSYILENDTYTAMPGDIFLVRPNEQHCVPTIFTPELCSFNIYVTSYCLWNICSEYVEPTHLAMLVGNSDIIHRFVGRQEMIERIISLCSSPESAEKHRHELRLCLLELIISITGEFDENTENDLMLKSAMKHQNDIQNAITFINENLTESISLDDIAKSAGLSRSHISTLFKSLTGISPYEYLLLQRIERSIELLRNTDTTVVEIAYSCGFRNLANFNKSFKKITSMTPSEYRESKR